MVELGLVLISLLGGAMLTMVGVWLLRLKNLISKDELSKAIDEESKKTIEKLDNIEKIWNLKFSHTDALYQEVLGVVRDNNKVINEFKNELHDFKIELTELRAVLDVAKAKKSC